MRAQVVLLQGDRILLARHEKSGHRYWVLPGGSIERGETSEEAAIREVREETGLEIALDRLLLIERPGAEHGLVIRQPRYTFLAHIVGGSLEERSDPQTDQGHGRLTGTDWLSWDDPQLDAATRATLERVRAALVES